MIRHRNESVVLLTVLQTKDAPECFWWPLRGGHMQSEGSVFCVGHVSNVLCCIYSGTSSYFSMMIYQQAVKKTRMLFF